MKILLISSRYLPHRGGLESVVSHLAQEYKARGHQVKIVTNRYPRALPAKEVVEGIPVERLFFILPQRENLVHSRVDLWLAGCWYQFYTRWQLQKIIEQFNPDVINNHYLNDVVEFTGRCLEKSSQRIPWVISLHGGDVDGEPNLSPRKLVRFRRWADKADRLTACSRFLADQAEAIAPELEGRIQVIHNGVEIGRFSNAVPSKADNQYVLAVGQLVRHKGFDFLIRSFAALDQKFRNVQLWIAGEGEQRHTLEELITQKHLENRVRLLGKVDEDQVASLMAGSLFVAMPSFREPFGIVALEGMASGKPVLASAVGGLLEFIPVPPNKLVQLDQSAWVAAMDEWLELALQGKLTAPMNQQHASRFDWPKVAEQYLQVYKSIALG